MSAQPTLPEAREILAQPMDHTDAELRAAARVALELGTPDDAPRALRFEKIGLSRKPDPLFPTPSAKGRLHG